MRTFRSLQRFSIWFRSGDWLGHSLTLKCFLQSHSLVILAVCFGSLSCWKTQPQPIFNALTEGRRLLPKILQYGPSHPLLNTVQSPCPVCRKTPPCFTVGMVFLLIILLPPNKVCGVMTKKVLFLVSSDHMTFSHDSSGSSKWSLSNLRRALTCWFKQWNLESQ